LSGKFTDENGMEWSISLNMTFVEGTEEDEARIRDNPNGDNMLILYKDGSYANAANIDGKQPPAKFIRKEPNNIMSKVIGRYAGTSRMAELAFSNGKGELSDGNTAFHEVLHLFGLSDRYSMENRKYLSAHTGYSGDIMAMPAGYRGRYNMNKTHWDSWGDYVTKNGLKSGDIINVVVDKDPITQNLRQP